jgi:hypothetical protein
MALKKPTKTASKIDRGVKHKYRILNIITEEYVKSMVPNTKNPYQVFTCSKKEIERLALFAYQLDDRLDKVPEEYVIEQLD